MGCQEEEIIEGKASFQHITKCSGLEDVSGEFSIVALFEMEQKVGNSLGIREF